jgi:MarR family transcriptional regulator, negative regulator of the multidrug operon emrRAB
MLAEQFEAIQASVERVRARGVALPVDDVVLFRVLVLVGRSLGQHTEEAIRPFGLAEAEFRVLVELFSRPSGVGHPGELCAGATQSPATMTRTTDGLVGRGLISRVPSELDRRRMILRITTEGEALVRLMLPGAFDHMRTLFDAFSGEARRLLLGHLKEVAAALDQLETAEAVRRTAARAKDAP